MKDFLELTEIDLRAMFAAIQTELLAARPWVILRQALVADIVRNVLARPEFQWEINLDDVVTTTMLVFVPDVFEEKFGHKMTEDIRRAVRCH